VNETGDLEFAKEHLLSALLLLCYENFHPNALLCKTVSLLI
jgi:hypothetical protein